MILSVKFANVSRTSVVLITQDAGPVVVQLPPLPDVSGGWREDYEEFCAAGGVTEDYQAPPVSPITLEEYASRQGYPLFNLMNLMDLEAKLRGASFELPPKAAAVRDWVDGVRVAFASGQEAVPAPYPYSEVEAEVLELLLNQ